MQSCTNNTIIRGLRLPPCWYSVSVCNQEYSRECSHDSHSFGRTYLEQASWNLHCKYVATVHVYLCYFFCIVYVIL